MDYKGINKYQSFVRFFLKRYEGAIVRTAMKYWVAPRFDIEDLKQYIGAKILDRLKVRDAGNRPIRNPVRYFRGCIGFYCAEYRRMSGFTVTFPPRPRIPGGPDEREAAEKQYIYMSLIDGDSIVEHDSKTDQDSGLVRAIIGSLDTDVGQAFRMVVIDGLDVRDAARLLGVRSSKIKTLVEKGREQLKEILAKRPDLLALLERPRLEPDQNGLHYLGGPYTSTNELIQEARLEAIDNAYKELVQRGWKIYSPLSSTVRLARDLGLPTSWEFWRAQDLEILSRCDSLLVLPLDGWLESTGLTAELHHCIETGMPVHFLTV